FQRKRSALSKRRADAALAYNAQVGKADAAALKKLGDAIVLTEDQWEACQTARPVVGLEAMQRANLALEKFAKTRRPSAADLSSFVDAMQVFAAAAARLGEAVAPPRRAAAAKTSTSGASYRGTCDDTARGDPDDRQRPDRDRRRHRQPAAQRPRPGQAAGSAARARLASAHAQPPGVQREYRTLSERGAGAQGGQRRNPRGYQPGRRHGDGAGRRGELPRRGDGLHDHDRGLRVKLASG